MEVPHSDTSAVTVTSCLPPFSDTEPGERDNLAPNHHSALASSSVPASLTAGRGKTEARKNAAAPANRHRSVNCLILLWERILLERIIFRHLLLWGKFRTQPVVFFVRMW